MKQTPLYVLYGIDTIGDEAYPHSVHDTVDAAKNEARRQDAKVSARHDAYLRAEPAAYNDGWSDPDDGYTNSTKLRFTTDSDADGDSEGYHSYTWAGWQIQAQTWGDILELF